MGCVSLCRWPYCLVVSLKVAGSAVGARTCCSLIHKDSNSNSSSIGSALGPFLLCVPFAPSWHPRRRSFDRVGRRCLSVTKKRPAPACNCTCNCGRTLDRANPPRPPLPFRTSVLFLGNYARLPKERKYLHSLQHHATIFCPSLSCPSAASYSSKVRILILLPCSAPLAPILPAASRPASLSHRSLPFSFSLLVCGQRDRHDQTTSLRAAPLLPSDSPSPSLLCFVTLHLDGLTDRLL